MQPMISLCMIVRNEAGRLERCVRSVSHVVDEIIVVDTGSEDGTVEIAQKLGAKVFHHRWNDDFSEARNRALECASGDWVLVLDADEAVSPRDSEKIRALAARDFEGYVFTYRSYSRNSHDMRWVANDGSYEEGNGWDGWISGQVVRMFRRDERIRFSGAVHESVDQSILGLGGKLAQADILIHHFHEEKGEEVLRRKQLHYLRLCEKNLQEFPGSAKTYFDMGLIHRYVLKDIRQAIAHQRKALELDPRFEDARMELALLYHLEGDTTGAARELRALLECNPALAPAWLLCGIMLERRGRFDRAVECYERAVKLNPNLIDARMNLGTLLLKRRDFARARIEWEKVCSLNPSNVRALINLGALELGGGNLASAQAFFEEALAHSPENALVWNNLGVLYLRRGQNADALGAFERAHALDSSREDVRRNLETLRQAGVSSV